MSRILHLSLFLGIFAAILASSHFYMWARLASYLHLTAGSRRLLGAFFTSLGTLTLLSLPLSRLLPRPFATILDWIAFPWMGIALLLFLIMAVTDFGWLGVNLAAPLALADPTRRLALKQIFGLSALGVTALLGGVSLWEGLRPVVVKPLTITLNRLPKALDGLRIVQITDLHIGPTIKGSFLRGIVDKVNALKPDVIAVTGDLVDGSLEDLKEAVAPIAELSAPLGVYFITGNHEYYSGVEDWCTHLAQLGLRVLRNERVSIGRGGESIDLAGVDDWASRQFPGEGADLGKALAGRDPRKALILLAHQPAAIDEASQHGVDLQLSGHTHGGQIWPFTYLVYLQQPYVRGLHRHRDAYIYVSEGTGYWGPPMRLGTAAEITHITLRAA
jgi:predicted MPP superfamily phosphohydrolase